jgi:hypothetical protein
MYAEYLTQRISLAGKTQQNFVDELMETSFYLLAALHFFFLHVFTLNACFFFSLILETFGWGVIIM